MLIQADRCVRELHQKQFEHSNGSQKAISVQRAKSRRSGGYPPQGGGGFGGPRPHSPYQVNDQGGLLRNRLSFQRLL